MRNTILGLIIAGFCAGTVNGLLGAGGGMVLVPLLAALTDMQDEDTFPSSVSIILPVCLVSVMFSLEENDIKLHALIPFLIGSLMGGFLSGIFGKKIPGKWLHRIFGIFMLWGGLRYLC